MFGSGREHQNLGSTPIRYPREREDSNWALALFSLLLPPSSRRGRSGRERGRERGEKKEYVDLRDAGDRCAAVRCRVEGHVSVALLQLGRRRRAGIGGVFRRRGAGKEDDGGGGGVLLQAAEEGHRSPHENQAEEDAAVGCAAQGPHRLRAPPQASCRLVSGLIIGEPTRGLGPFRYRILAARHSELFEVPFWASSCRLLPALRLFCNWLSLNVTHQGGRSILPPWNPVRKLEIEIAFSRRSKSYRACF